MGEIGRWIVLVLIVAVIAIFITALQIGPQKWSFWKRYFVIGLPSTALILLTYIYFREYIDLAMGKVALVTETNQGRLEIATMVVSAGVLAHFFKRKNQIRYGQVEVIIGALSAFKVAEGINPAEAFSRWAALVGCSYFIARGLNNWSDGLMRLHGHSNVSSHVKSWFFEDSSENNQPGKIMK